MDLSTILGLVGIFVSACFGLWGVYLALKNRYPGKVTFVREQSIGIFDEIVKNLPELEVLYSKAPISKNLVLLKGALLNDGSLDLAPANIEKPISLVLPKGFTWVESNILSCSKNVSASIDLLSQHELQIKTGLFRTKEYIRFQALAEVPNDDSEQSKDHKELGEKLLEALRFDHRIANTKKISATQIESIDKRKLRKKIIIPVLAGILGTIMVIGMYFFTSPQYKLVYKYKIEDESTVSVTVSPTNDDKIKIKGFNQEYSQVMNRKEFFKDVLPHPEIKESKEERLTLIFAAILYLILPIFMALPSYLEFRRSKNLKKALNIDEASKTPSKRDANIEDPTFDVNLSRVQ